MLEDNYSIFVHNVVDFFAIQGTVYIHVKARVNVQKRANVKIRVNIYIRGN